MSTKCVKRTAGIAVVPAGQQAQLSESLDEAFRKIHAAVPPLWPLENYVAVNPCFGLTDQRFLVARQFLTKVRDCDLLMPRSYFQSLFAESRLGYEDLRSAHAQCLEEYPDLYGSFSPADLTEWLADSTTLPAETDIRIRTVAEVVDRRQGSSWSSHFINDITRHCAAHYDQGQAAWNSPWQGASLYAAWKEAAKLSRRMDLLGLPGFRAFVAELPENPRQAVNDLLVMLGISESQWEPFLLCMAYSISGWASYIRRRVRDAEFAGHQDEDLIGLIAIRMAYDAALARKSGIHAPVSLWPAKGAGEGSPSNSPNPAIDVLARYMLQVATEQLYRRELLQKLTAQSVPRPIPARRTLQMVFCIDVRSEVLRRNLESIEDSIETFGFAGFFGMPLEYVPIEFETGIPQCPVLLQPTFRVHQKLSGGSKADEDALRQKRLGMRLSRKLWKSFQTSATSCFAFAETVGLSYFSKLLTDSLHWRLSFSSTGADELNSGGHLGPDIRAEHNEGLDATRRIDLAEGVLRNLGLTTGLARVVILCGHACDVTNNPYRAALDCGACGGHSGEPNARVAVALLNDADVRAGLSARGIEIPDDTFFLAAVHQTTTDSIELCNLHRAPDSHTADLRRIKNWLHEAGRLSRIERGPRLGSRNPDDLLRRSRDWSEVRPEWGLAGNAAFIVAPRSRSAGIRLDGRTFLQSYDHKADPEYKALELIMTAPMIVTNWINMQYYASTVDPVAFGSGNKVIHNVVGQFGILQGNGGDLMTGLPWQSIHDGTTLQHEPLRLVVVIEAPCEAVERIINRHLLVRNLVTNGWVTLMVFDRNQAFRWTSPGTWVAEQTAPNCPDYGETARAENSTR